MATAFCQKQSAELRKQAILLKFFERAKDKIYPKLTNGSLHDGKYVQDHTYESSELMFFLQTISES